MFVIDEQLHPILSEEPSDEDSPLHALYRPRDGQTSPLLTETLAQLIRRARRCAARRRG